MVLFKVKEFIEYLEYIVNKIYNDKILQGIITKETSLYFNDIMKENINDKNKEIDYIEVMKDILYSYLKGSNDEYIKLISNTMMNNFILYKKRMISKKLNIYKKQELLLIKENLFIWKKDSLNNNSKSNNLRDNYFHLNLNVGPIMNNSNGGSIIINNNNQLNYKTRNYNYSNRNKREKIDSYERKKERGEIDDKIKKNRYSSEKIVNKFIRRQEKYSMNNSQKKEEMIKENEEENKLIYTFEPEINSSLRKLYKKDNLNVSKRLYNDSIIRNNKRLEKEMNNKSKNISLSGKPYNKNKYIELYEDSKLRKGKKEELIKRIEKECGYTYEPNITNKKHNIKKNFKKKENISFNNRKRSKINNLKKIEKNNSCKSLLIKNNKKENKDRKDI